MINSLLNKLEESEKILIISHKSPDGDSLGSILGLGLALKKKYGEKINIAINDPVPERFDFLKTDNIGYTDSSEDYDLVMMLDCADINRAGIEIDSEKIVNIDHHITNKSFGKLNFVYSEASSTSEIVFNILKEMNIEMDKDIAEALYTGILTDTGSFKYSSTSPDTHRVAGDLLDIGIDRDKIVQRLFQNSSLKTIQLMKEAVINMEMFYSGKMAYLDVTDEILKNSGAEVNETESLVEFLRDIEGVEVSVMLKDSESGTKGSMRSKKDVDVAKIASVFGGGGHTRAAGFSSDLERSEIKEKLIELIGEGLDEVTDQSSKELTNNLSEESHDEVSEKGQD